MEDTAEGIQTGVDGDSVADTSGVATIEGDVFGSVSGDVANVADVVDASAGQGGWRFTCPKKNQQEFRRIPFQRDGFLFWFLDVFAFQRKSCNKNTWGVRGIYLVKLNMDAENDGPSNRNFYMYGYSIVLRF